MIVLSISQPLVGLTSCSFAETSPAPTGVETHLPVFPTVFSEKVVQRMKTVRRRKAAKRGRPAAGRRRGKAATGIDPMLDGLSSLELLDLGERVDAAIAAREAEARSALRDEFRDLAQAAGFTLAEVLDGRRGGKGNARAAKYANPDDASETWSGRGRMPGWLASRLKAGATRGDFEV